MNVINQNRSFLAVGVALLSLYATGMTTRSASALEFSHDFAEASAAAQRSNKPLIVIFSASWCPPCQKMKKSVYPSRQVQPYHDSFVWAYLDADQSKNKPLMQKYGVSGIPHISFISPAGGLVGHFSGAVSPQQFTKILDQVKVDIVKAGGRPANVPPSQRKGSGSKR
ncbi:MAG: thioredoxin family protein [Verrucomicrobiales bacterium]|nr:thioredoxin family protein [Verrucomicrobiales bacterium]